MALIRFILLIILLYFILKFVFRLFFGYSMRNMFNSGRDNQHSNRKRDGEITVNSNSSDQGKKISKEEGEYIKFEEIKGKDKRKG